MLGLAAGGLLELYYVVISDHGNEVSRHRHPESPPLGKRVLDQRAEEPSYFTVKDDDIYLVFAPTDTLLDLAQPERGEPSPKARGAAARATAPTGPVDEERAISRPDLFDRTTGTIRIDRVEKLTVLNMGDFKAAGGDIVEGNKVTTHGKVKGSVTGGGSAAPPTLGSSPPGPKKGGGVVWGSLVVVGLILVVAAVLAATNTVTWAEAIGGATIASVILGGANMVASHRRSS
jgi:hypothetical protein